MTARTARLPSCGFKKSADFGDLGNKSSPLLVQSFRDYDSLKFKSSHMGCVCAATILILGLCLSVLFRRRAADEALVVYTSLYHAIR